MVINPEILRQFELDFELKTNYSYKKRLQMYESMHLFQISLLPNQNPLNGLTDKIELIKRLHSAERII